MTKAGRRGVGGTVQNRRCLQHGLRRMVKIVAGTACTGRRIGGGVLKGQKFAMPENGESKVGADLGSAAHAGRGCHLSG